MTLPLLKDLIIDIPNCLGEAHELSYIPKYLPIYVHCLTCQIVWIEYLHTIIKFMRSNNEPESSNPEVCLLIVNDNKSCFWRNSRFVDSGFVVWSYELIIRPDYLFILNVTWDY